MEEIGVEAVVKGLTSFLGDLRKINSGLDSIRPQATLLQQAVGGVMDSIAGMGRELLNIIEFTLGQLLADAIEFVITKLGELVGATIDAGKEFQTLELRLDRLNFNDLTDSGLDYNDATAESIKLTQAQLQWLQKLAAQTPYDNTDISNIFTLARSYGFASDRAQGLTEDVADFTAGMGLTEVEMVRIMKNFGQMNQLGKVMQRDLNDLAVGAFVPVNKILADMQQQVGMTDGEFQDFLKTQQGVDAFMEAFAREVEGSFGGAAEKMSRTFGAASDNALDLVKSIGGLNVVKPVLDVIGGEIADFVDQFTKNPERWDRIVEAATRVGTAIASIVTGIFGLMPSSEGLAESLITGLESFATWLEDNKEEIIAFFKNLGDTIKNDLIPFLRDQLVPAIQTTTDFIIENKDEIGGWIAALTGLFIAWQLVATSLNLLINTVITLAGFLLSVFATVSAITTVLRIAPLILSLFGAGLSAIGPIILILVAIIGTLIFWIGLIMWNIEILKTGIPLALDFVKRAFEGFKNLVVETIVKVISALREGDWFGAGMAIIQGIIDGVQYMQSFLIGAVTLAAENAFGAAKRVLGINSPSTLFMEIGEDTMAGFAKGIEKYAQLASGSMAAAMSQVAAPAMMMPALASAVVGGGRSVTHHSEQENNYNLTVHSGGSNEQIIQDFNMLQSLQGV